MKSSPASGRPSPGVAHCVGAEDAEELIQDGTTMAARLLIRSERDGKKVTAGNIAYYTIQHVKAGRRFHKFSKVDVMAAGTQIAGRTRLSSLEEVVASDQETGGEIFLFHDVLSRDEEDPSTRAARRLDWAEFYAGLPERERAAVEFLLEGKTLREAGRSLGFSDSSMQQSRKALAPHKILHWLRVLPSRTLNIAGPSEAGVPGIGDQTFALFQDVFRSGNPD